MVQKSRLQSAEQNKYKQVAGTDIDAGEDNLEVGQLVIVDGDAAQPFNPHASNDNDEDQEEEDDDPYCLHVLACLSCFIFPPFALIGCCRYGCTPQSLPPRQNDAWEFMVLCAFAGCFWWFICRMTLMAEFEGVEV